MNTRAGAAALITLALAACTSTPTLTPTPGVSPTPAPTPTAAPTVPPTPTLVPTLPPTPNPTVEPTPTPTATATAAPTATPTAAPSATPTASPTTAPPEWPSANHIVHGGFSEPAVAVAPSGNVHVAARAADNEGIWYATNASGKWVDHQVVDPWNADPEMTGTVDEPAIAVDPIDGSIWIAFVYWQCDDCAPGWPDGIYMVNNVGGTWSDPVQLNSGDGAINPSLAVKNGRVYLAWAGSGDYFHRYGPVGFGTDASGAWQVQQVAKAGAFPKLTLDNDGRADILFGGDVVRYAHQRANGSFLIERLPETTGVGGHFAHPVLAVDPVSGDTWAAWSAPIDDHGNYNTYVASRGPTGWSDPVAAIAGSELIGLGVRNGVVQVAADKAGIAYAGNGSGAFVEQIVFTPSNFWWGDAAFALLPNGRPIVVIARDIPSNQSGMWFLKGPAV